MSVALRHHWCRKRKWHFEYWHISKDLHLLEGDFEAEKAASSLPHPTDDSSDLCLSFQEVHHVISFRGLRSALPSTVPSWWRNKWHEMSLKRTAAPPWGWHWVYVSHSLPRTCIYCCTWSTAHYRLQLPFSRRGKITLRVVFSKARRQPISEYFLYIKGILKTWFGYSDRENLFIQNG